MITALKTRYEQDIAIARHGRDFFWYGLLLAALILFPTFGGEFYVGEFNGVFIFAICGVAQMLLLGYTGLISLCHAAFLGIGAYTHAILLAHGVPFAITVPCAGIMAALGGLVIGIPTLRMSGLYLAIATLAFGTIVSTIFQKWTAVTGGWGGFNVPVTTIFGFPFGGTTSLYYSSLALLVAVLWIAINILRSPFGRALVAIRDSEISAQSMGINLRWYKAAAFAISAGITGLAGALYAHYIRALAPDAFDLLISIQLVVIVFVGGFGTLHGAVIGAIFVRFLPQVIAIFRDDLPFGVGRLPGLEPALFGLVLVLVILFEPLGIYGRWLKLKIYFQSFPLSRRAVFRRQRSYTKTERLR